VLDDIFQALPFDELHHHERTPIVSLIDVFHAHGVGVLQLAREGGFLAEALHEGRIARQLQVDHLQRAHLVKSHVQRLIDGRHPPLAQLAQDAILAANHGSL
jgi:precorrin-6x reductase